LADITDSRPDILTDTERVGNMHFALKSDGNKKLAFNRLEEFAKKKTDWRKNIQHMCYLAAAKDATMCPTSPACVHQKLTLQQVRGKTSNTWHFY
jgi:hypothetical protein